MSLNVEATGFEPATPRPPAEWEHRQFMALNDLKQLF